MTDHIVTIGLTFLLAGVVKGVIGLGLPTVAMGLLGLVMPPAQAAGLLLLPSLVTNVWQLAAGPRFGALLHRLWPMLAAIVVATWAGSGLIAASSSTLPTAALGVALAAYALSGLFLPGFSVPARMEWWAGPLVGAATGLVTGATGVFVIPAVPYLGALERRRPDRDRSSGDDACQHEQLPRDELIQALGLSFTASTLALAGGLFWHGVLVPAVLGVSMLALAASLAGMALGGWLRGRLSPTAFRRCFFTGLLALAAEIVWHALA